MKDVLLEGVTLTRCPSCQAVYTEECVRELYREGSRCVLHASCSACADAMVLSVVKRQGGVVCAGLLSDCTYEDALRFLRAPRITADQVIEAHATRWAF